MRPDSDLAPAKIVGSLMLYRDHGVPTGSFLEAVLENNLSEAVGRADCHNLEALPHIVAWVYNCMWAEAWGSPKKVKAWLKHKGAEHVKEVGRA